MSHLLPPIIHKCMTNNISVAWFFGKIYACLIAVSLKMKGKQSMQNNETYQRNHLVLEQTDGGFGFLLKELNHLLENPSDTSSSYTWGPISGHETELGYRYDFELPGLKKDELKVTLTEGVLALRGKKKVFRNGIENDVEVNRSLLVPDDVDPQKVRAKYVDGVLTVEISKRKKLGPKSVEIQVS